MTGRPDLDAFALPLKGSSFDLATYNGTVTVSDLDVRVSAPGAITLGAVPGTQLLDRAFPQV